MFSSGGLRRTLVASVGVLPLFGCLHRHDVADIGAIYRDAAKVEGPERRPVIVIPGILGSKLVQPGGGRIVWGAFGGEYADPSTPEGARLFALPMRRGAALSALRDEVIPDGALDRVTLNVLGLPIELNAYYNLLVTLGVGGYRDQQLAKAGAIDYGGRHFSCFQFAYDWRRSNVENAALLAKFIEERRAYVQGVYRREYGPGDYDVKFNIVAHSMGGLLARYYLQYGDAPLPEDSSLPELTWAGAKHVAKTILIGTPNAGSVLAMRELVEGSYPAPIVEPYRPAIVGTLPAVYELMPRGRHGAVVIDGDAMRREEALTDSATWRRYGWGLLDPKEDEALAMLLPDVASADERRAIAADHLDKCLRNAERFWAALDRPATPPPGLEVHLYAGDATQTQQVVSVNSRNGRLSTFATAPGDGTVTRASALMDERQGGASNSRLKTPIAWEQVTFLFEDHLGLTKAPSFSDNVLYQLLETR